MIRLAPLFTTLIVIALVASACGDSDAPSIPVDAAGFPLDWPVAVPPGNVTDCDSGTISQEDALFTVVMCLPDEPEPFTASEQYLATLESDGFIEREPGAFITSQQTFLDGNGIEIFFQLIGDEATVILIRPAS